MIKNRFDALEIEDGLAVDEMPIFPDVPMTGRNKGLTNAAFELELPRKRTLTLNCSVFSGTY